LKSEIQIGELSYVLQFVGHELSFYVDGSKTRKKIYVERDQNDQFFGFDFYDAGAEMFSCPVKL
jgi:hypothetical protein